jgi:acyl-CoA synthetase (AMP-forming)/AMP-acid ligase II
MQAVSLGPPAPGISIGIVDNEGNSCKERVVGEIAVSGRSVGRIEGNASLEDRVLTGDLGFSHEGEVYVVGRRKELIILRGQNVYPADIEAAALEAHSAIRPGGLAAVGVMQGGTESLLLVIEVARTISAEQRALLCRRVNEAVIHSTGFAPWRTLVVPPGSLKRTTSGKIQRGLIAEMYMLGELKPLNPTRLRAAEELDA